MNGSTMLLESEPVASALLGSWINGTGVLSLQWQPRSLTEARALLVRNCPDVLFCSVELIDGTGFDVLDHVSRGTRHVFVGDSPEHAVRAFDVEAIDYLVRPLRAARFAEAVRRVTKPHPPQFSRVVEPSARVLVQDGSREQVVELDDLVAIVAVGGNYTELLCTSGTSIEARCSIKHWERMLPRDSFVRTHRSAIVNLAFVERLEGGEQNRVSLRRHSSSLELPVSRRLAPGVRQALRARSAA